jgi:O-antigen/teichoic acid export membrane protein
MDLVLKIRNNSFFSLLAQFIRLTANSLFFIVIARVYGPIGFGIFTTAQIYTAFFWLLGDFGIDMVLLTELGKDSENKKIISSLLSLKVLLSLLGVMGVWAFAISLEINSSTKLLMFVLGASVISNNLSTFFFSILKGLGKFSSEAFITVFQNAIYIFLTLVVVYLKLTIFILALIYVLNNIIGFSLAFYVLRSNVQFDISFDISSLTRTFRKVLPFGTHLIFGTLFFTIDSILLSLYLNENNVGLYQSAFKLVALVLVLPDVLSITLLPTFSHLFYKDILQWEKLLMLFLRFFIFLGSIVGGIFILFAGNIMEFVYGKNVFVNAIPLMKIFGGVIFFRYTTAALGVLITTSNHQIYRTKTVLVATFFNLAMNIYFIPYLNTLGAGVVSLLTNMLVLILFLFYSKKISELILTRRIVSRFIFEIGVFICIFLLDIFTLDPFVKILIAFVLLVVSFFLLFSATEKKGIIKMFTQIA